MNDDPTQADSLVGIHGRHAKDPRQQIDVVRDNGRTLMLVSPPDLFEIIESGEAKPS
jgi:hypothetical protein